MQGVQIPKYSKSLAKSFGPLSSDGGYFWSATFEVVQVFCQLHTCKLVNGNIHPGC
jgi:hypothetical protein